MRRVKFVCATFVTAALSSSSQAQDIGPETTGLEITRDLCIERGGEIVKVSDKEQCVNEQRDRECRAQNPDSQDSFYNEATGECDNFCFLTTACVNIVGLSDDCFELQELRKMRDNYMSRTSIMREQASLYRYYAPKILASLSRNGRAQVLRHTYARTILPAAILGFVGLKQLSYRLYLREMRTLITLTGVKIRPGDERLFNI